MKTLLPVLLFTVPCYGQTDCLPLDSTGVVAVEGVTATELHSRAKAWYAVAFKDSKEVVQMDDENSKTMIGKGTVKYPEKYVDGGWFKYTVEISCREGRYRYSINTISHDNPRVSTTYVGGVSGSYELPDFGLFYDCDLCCQLHKTWAEEHPKNTSGLAKRKAECKKDIQPKVDELVNRVVASIMEAMAKPAGDW